MLSRRRAGSLTLPLVPIESMLSATIQDTIASPITTNHVQFSVELRGNNKASIAALISLSRAIASSSVQISRGYKVSSFDHWFHVLYHASESQHVSGKLIDDLQQPGVTMLPVCSYNGNADDLRQGCPVGDR